MLEEIYYKRKLGMPYITLLIVITCSIVSIPTFFNHELYEVFASHGTVMFWWQYFSGNFEHCLGPMNGLKEFFWAHYLGNMFMFIVNGVILERIIGNKKMFFLIGSALIVTCIEGRIFYGAPGDTGAGASGMAWAILPSAFCIWIQSIKVERKKSLKSPLFYIMGWSFIMGWIIITLGSSWEGTNRSHVIATIIGILGYILYKKDIKAGMRQISNKEETNSSIKRKGDKACVWVTCLLPICMISIMGAYYYGHVNIYEEGIVLQAKLDDVPSKGEKIYYQSYEDLEKNEGKVEIVFNQPIRGDEYSIWLDMYSEEGKSGIKPNITYSKDRRKVYISIEHYQEIKGGICRLVVDRLISESGKSVIPMRIIIK